MEIVIPNWAMEVASPHDRERVIDAYRMGMLQITWPDRKALRLWAKRQGWPVPGWIFDGKFLKKMLESDETFALALSESGLQVQLPRQHYRLPDEDLEEMDALYEAREDMGVLGMRPTMWGTLVEWLREIRRAIEAGVEVEIAGRKLRSVGDFLTWAHARYHMLEDGYDSWIGDDKS